MKTLGIWGWWTNRPDTVRKLENPTLCIFTNSLVDINEEMLAEVGKVCYRIRTMEINHYFSKDLGILEDDKVTSNELAEEPKNDKRVDDRDELEVEHREIVDSEEEEKENSSS